MKKFVILFIALLLLTGCPSIPKIIGFGNKSEKSEQAAKEPDVNVSTVVAAQAAKEALETKAAEKKAADDRKNMEAE